MIHSEEYDHIAEVIGRIPDGARLDEILAALEGRVSRRTLQRRLADLVTQGRILGGREKKSFTYPITAVTGTVDATEDGDDQMGARGEVYLPTSPEGNEIKVYVRRPLQGRSPVSYNLEFLDAYRPNETWYLPRKLRDQVQALGRSPADQAPAGTFQYQLDPTSKKSSPDSSWRSSRPCTPATQFALVSGHWNSRHGSPKGQRIDVLTSAPGPLSAFRHLGMVLEEYCSTIPHATEFDQSSQVDGFAQQADAPLLPCAAGSKPPRDR